ncbi:MAG: DUF4276 family protein [Polyangia bacterium]
MPSEPTLQQANWCALIPAVFVHVDPEHLLCIPIEEIEAWLLSDPEAIATAIGLANPPKVPQNTETIPSPKEFLQRLVRRASNGERIYVHTQHNEKVAEYLHFGRVRRCSSFVPFYDFVAGRIRLGTASP